MKSQKHIIPIILCILNFSMLHAANYYFSASKGLDTNNATQAQNQSTPWKSISKLNQMQHLLKPGDVVSFKKGDVFLGTIKLNISGNPENPIVFSAYGQGNQKPIIEGLITLDKWALKTENIWESSAEGLRTQPTALTINNKLQALGRYPNIEAPNRGYLTIDSHPADSKKEFTYTDQSQSTDWTGAEIVLRADQWIMNKIPLSKQNGKTLTLATDAKKLKDKFGFFIQNHPATLDKNGEWSYLASENKILLYSTENPNKQAIKVAGIDYCFQIENQSDIRIDGLKLMGSIKCEIKLDHCRNIKISHCEFVASGTNSICFGYFGSLNNENISIENNSFTDIQSTCLKIFGKDIIVKNNRFKNIAIVPGMAESGQEGGVINTLADKISIERNVMDSIGYLGISFLWSSNVLVKENVISNFCTVIDDGAGIYCWMNDKDAEPVNRKIVNNIILNGIGAPQGTPEKYAPAEGIYLDDRSPNVEVSNNTIVNCTNSGIYLHNSPKNVITNNTILDCDKAIWIKNDKAKYNTNHCVVQQNILLSKSSTGKESLLSIRTIDHSEMSQLGTINKNVLGVNKDGSVTNYISSTPEKTNKRFDLKQWSEFSGYDIDSKAFIINGTEGDKAVKNYRFEYNTGDNVKSFIADADYISATTQQKIRKGDTVSINPFCSVVLFKQ